MIGGKGAGNKKEVLLTEQGLAEVKAELEDLKTHKRREVAQRLREATAQGDLSENSEYDTAKEDQAFMEARILVLEDMLSNYKLIEADKRARDVVDVGSTVTVQELPDGELETYTIVGRAETSPDVGKISNESPLGLELIGKKAEDVIQVSTPSGNLSFKVIKLS